MKTRVLLLLTLLLYAVPVFAVTYPVTLTLTYATSVRVSFVCNILVPVG